MTLDKNIQNFLNIFNKIPVSPKEDIPKGREDYLHFALYHAGWPLKMARVEDVTVKAVDGHDIPLRIYTPKLNEKLPVFVYIHGGGWQRGDIATHDSICRHLSVNSDCIVVSVEWRLAPEHRFPIGIRDCFDSYKWVLKEISKYNGDPHRVGVGGDSAGGNLTAALFQKIRDEKIHQPQLQLLIYPALDLTCSADSYEKFGEGYFLSTDHVKKYVSSYLPSADSIKDPLACPIKQQDFSYLPRTHIVYAGFDPLRGDSEAYIEKLKNAGVNVTSKCYEGMIHAFLHMNHTAPAVEVALKEIGEVIKETLHK